MSKSKQIVILAAVSIFLGLTLVTGLIVRNGGFSSGTPKTVVPGTLDAKHLTGISISHAGTTLALKHENGQWYRIDGDDELPVRESRIDDMLTALKSLTLGRVVSRNSAGYADLKIDDNTAWKVNLSTDDGTLQPALYFGDSNGQVQYFRSEGGTEVTAIPSSLSFYLQQEPKYWLERRLWSDVDLKTVNSFTFQSKGKPPLVIAKNENAGGWHIEKGDKPSIKKDQLPTWVQAMAALEGDDIQTLVGAAVPAGYTETIRLSVSSEGGIQRVLVFYADNKKEDPLLAVPSFQSAPTSKKGIPLGFLIPEWKLQRGVVE